MLALGMVSIMVWHRAWLRSSGVVIGGDTDATVLGTALLCASGSDSRGGGATGYQYKDRNGLFFW